MSNENKNSLDEQKGVAYYSALVNAWITTRMEKDRQLLTLSSAGIGLIIIFQPKLNSVFEFNIWLLAGICFLFSIALLLSVFTDNGDLIEAEINQTKSILKDKLDKRISLKTKISGWLFILGAILALSILYGAKEYVVSTVCLPFCEWENPFSYVRISDRPLIFETIVFENKSILYEFKNYCINQAKRDHDDMILRVIREI